MDLLFYTNSFLPAYEIFKCGRLSWPVGQLLGAL